MMKLYQGGCGTAKGYIVAENERKAIQELSHKLGIPYLPVEVTEVEVEGYEITVTKKKGKKKDAVGPTDELVSAEPTGEDGGEVVEPVREDAIEGEGNPGTEGSDKADGGKGRTRKKSSK